MMSSDGRRPTNTGALAFFHFARTFNPKSINGNLRSVNENTHTSGFLISGKLLVITDLGGWVPICFSGEPACSRSGESTTFPLRFYGFLVHFTPAPSSMGPLVLIADIIVVKAGMLRIVNSFWNGIYGGSTERVTSDSRLV